MTNQCCEKCWGRVEDESGFSRNYGCQNKVCECHSHKDAELEKIFEVNFLNGNKLSDSKGATFSADVAFVVFEFAYNLGKQIGFKKGYNANPNKITAKEIYQNGFNQGKLNSIGDNERKYENT